METFGVPVRDSRQKDLTDSQQKIDEILDALSYPSSIEVT